MQNISINFRNVLIYGLVGIGLVALILLGITWAKNRSDQFAARSQEPAAQQGQDQGQNNGNPSSQGQDNQDGETSQGSQNSQNASQGGDQGAQSSQGGQQESTQQGGNNGSGTVATNGGGGDKSGNQTEGANSAGSSQVPATGAGDWLMLSAGLMLATYALIRFLQSRKAASF